MAQNDIKIPDISNLDPTNLSFDYDERSDSLYIYLTGVSQPAISVALDKFVLLRIDPETHELVGIEFEAFLSGAVSENPSLLAFAEMAGIREDVMDEWRRSNRSHQVSVKAVQRFLENNLEPSET